MKLNQKQQKVIKVYFESVAGSKWLEIKTTGLMTRATGLFLSPSPHTHRHTQTAFPLYDIGFQQAANCTT